MTPGSIAVEFLAAEKFVGLRARYVNTLYASVDRFLLNCRD